MFVATHLLMAHTDYFPGDSTCHLFRGRRVTDRDGLGLAERTRTGEGLQNSLRLWAHTYGWYQILTGHEKGVLSLSWCKQDADLLLSSGKDNRALCWNPQTSEIIGEVRVAYHVTTFRY